MTTFDYGPIEFYAIGFEGDRPGPAVLQAIDDLVASGTVNVLDLVFARRSPEGEIEVLAGQDDILYLAENLEPGSSAAILVIELLWAKSFAAALYDAGGAVIAREGIPAPIVNAFLAENAD